MPARIINLTPHEVTVIERDRAVTIPPSGIVARCRKRRCKFGYVEIGERQIPFSRVVFEAVEFLPPPADRTWYIVSSMVAMATRDRQDLLVPSGLMRRNGRIIGCKELAQS